MKPLTLTSRRLAVTIACALSILGGTWGAQRLLRPPATPASARTVVNASRPLTVTARVATYPGGDIRVVSDVDGHVVRMRLTELQEVGEGDVVAELEAAAPYSRPADRQRRAAGRHEVRTPMSGTVVSILAHEGDFVRVGSPLARIADLTHLRLEAQVDEDVVHLIRLRAPVRVRDATWEGLGEVEEIPALVEPRRQGGGSADSPAEPGVLSVKIRLLGDYTALRLGERVTAEIER